MVKSIHEFEYTSPLEYPGRRNQGNYILLDGTDVMDISEHPREAFEQIDTLLEERELPLLAERIPVLAFGRNASPSGAATKTEKYSHGELSAADLGTVPMLKATLSGHDVVWHGRPGQTGGYFAELIADKETEDTEVEVWVQFLTTEQLAIIHTTEGITYEMSEIDNVSLGDDVSIDTVGYTAREASLLLDQDGRPISVSGIERKNSSLREMNVRGALEYTLGNETVARIAETGSPDQYLDNGTAMNLAARKERQANVQKAMIEASMSRPYAHATDTIRFGRADYDSLPRGIDGRGEHSGIVNTMETHVQAVRPTKEALATKADQLIVKYPNESIDERIERARKLLDPALNLRKRATDELLDPNRQRRLEQLEQQGIITRKDQVSTNEQAHV